MELGTNDIERVLAAIRAHYIPGKIMQMTVKESKRGLRLVLTDAEEPSLT